MSELIDREATVKQICKIGEMVGGHDRDVVISIALFVQDDKTAFPTVDRPHGDWIPCSERLPKHSEIVLVSFKTGMVQMCKYLDDGSPYSWWSYKDDCLAWNNTVDAWMPLPEPYKKEGDEK